MFLKSQPGTSYLAHKGYLSGVFCPGGLFKGFISGGLRFDTPLQYDLVILVLPWYL